MRKVITHTNTSKDIATRDKLVAILGVDKELFNKCLRTLPLLYKRISLRKNSGGYRELMVPKESLKRIQRLILDKIFSDIQLPPCVYGFSRRRSIIENAKYHSKNDYLLNLDIKNFFPSVHFKKIKKIYGEIGLTEVSDILCNLTTFDYQLPQGAPTSPFLASFSLSNLDYRLTNLAKSNHILYSRYFDDFCFSGGKRIKTLEKSIINIIKEEGYRIKLSKRKLFEKNDTKEVNGILISNGKLFLKDTENLFRYVNDLYKYGLSILENNNPQKEFEIIQGKISFLKQVDKKQADKIEKIFNLIDWEI